MMTKRPIISLLLILCFAIPSFCQEDFGILYWTKERDLEWSDFKGSPLMDTSGGFYLDLYIESFNPSPSSWFISRNHEPKTFIYTNTSFADPELRSDDLLRYFNVYYDLAAVYANKLVVQINRARNSEDEFYANNSHIVKNAVIEEWKTESARLVLETQYGVEIERLLMWEREVQKQLDSIVAPVYTYSDYSVTFDLTAGPLIGLNEYDEFLTSPTAGVLGIELAKAPFAYSFGISGGGQTVKKTFLSGEDVFAVDTEPNIMNIFFLSGYQLIDSKRFRLVPRAGLHFSQLRYPNTEDIESSAWETFFATALTFDIKLGKWDNKSSMMFSDLGLRIGGYYYPMKVGEQNISHALITIGLSWTLGSIHVNYPEP